MKYLILSAVFFLLPLQTIAQTSEESTTQDTPYQAVITEDRTVTTDGTEHRIYQARFLDGPQAGQVVVIGDDESVTNIGYKNFRRGDRVYISTIEHISGTNRYLILDHVRTRSLWWLVALFVAAVAWLSRWHGLRSLVGLVLSFVILIGWIVPQIAGGANPILVTIAGGSVSLAVGILLVEGWKRSSLAAGIGTIATMVITGLISLWAVWFTHLTGEGTEETFLLQGVSQGNIDMHGLLLAGILIGTLGILDDIAFSQVAAVGELRRANPQLSRTALFGAAMRIGRSHLAAIINTLALAYAGAALPLLVLFHLGQQPTQFILNGEMVATEIVRTIVGSMGLVLAVPLSTLAAVWVTVRGSGQSDHSHGGPSGGRVPAGPHTQTE